VEISVNDSPQKKRGGIKEKRKEKVLEEGGRARVITRFGAGRSLWKRGKTKLCKKERILRTGEGVEGFGF